MINGDVCERYTYKCISGIRIMISTTQDSKFSFAMIDLFQRVFNFIRNMGNIQTPNISLLTVLVKIMKTSRKNNLKINIV